MVRFLAGGWVEVGRGELSSIHASFRHLPPSAICYIPQSATFRKLLYSAICHLPQSATFCNLLPSATSYSATCSILPRSLFLHYLTTKHTILPPDPSFVTCKQMKKDNPKHGQLAPRVVPSISWSEVHVDSIGPWEYMVNGLKVTVWALTMVDPVTNLVEIV